MSALLAAVRGVGQLLRPFAVPLRELVAFGIGAARKAKDSREVQKWLFAVALGALLWALAEGVV